MVSLGWWMNPVVVALICGTWRLVVVVEVGLLRAEVREVGIPARVPSEKPHGSEIWPSRIPPERSHRRMISLGLDFQPVPL